MQKIENLKYYLGTDIKLWYPEKLPLSEFLDTKKEQHTTGMGVVSMQGCISGNGSKPVLIPFADIHKRFDDDAFEIQDFRDYVGGDWCDTYDDALIHLAENLNNTNINALPFQLIKWLLKERYDIFGFIDASLAISEHCL